MDKHLSESETIALNAEFASRDKKSGIIGGYCEEGFPLYYANAEMAAMLGYDSVDELAQAIGGRVANTIHPDDLAKVEADLGGSYYEGMTYETTYRMSRKNGTWFWTVDRGKVLKAEDGRLAIISVCSDMSDFVRRQKELETENMASDYMFKSLPGGYHRCADDEDCTFLYVSERFLDILGWTADELKTIFHNKFAELLHPDDRELAREYVERIMGGSMLSPYQDVIYRLRGKNGYRWVSDTTMKVNIGDKTFFQGFISDVSGFISEREQREHELERLLEMSEQRYEIITALSKVYKEICIADLKEQTYTVVSGAGRAHSFTGKSGPLQELQQMFINHNIAPELSGEAAEFLDFSTIGQRLKETEFTARELKGKSGRWFLITFIVKSRDKSGEVTRVLLTARDVTEQKSREAEYQESLQTAVYEARMANEAKATFLRRMSHDIRTPLNGIIGLLKIDEMHSDDTEALNENRRKMQTAANHLLSLINDVLQMSKLEDGKSVLTHEVISLVDLTQDIVNIIIGRAVESGIEWNYEKGKSVIPYPYIYGSPVHLRQIFLNIYGNCIKYNRHGGKITTIVDTLGERDGKGVYRWRISDTGMGMSQEFLDHIFEPFSQERNDARSAYHGSGLGMSIVKSLLDQMGGTISVSSEVNVGTTFEIVIPFEIAEAPEPDAEEETRDGDIRGLHLMLAEDNELNAEIAQVLLRDAGAIVTVVSDGSQAVKLFGSSEEHEFDAILMDVMMPVMDGLAATRAIRALKRTDAETIPIIAMTANAFVEDAERCLAAGMNAHLAKPLEMKKAISVIAGCCKKASAPEES